MSFKAYLRNTFEKVALKKYASGDDELKAQAITGGALGGIPGAILGKKGTGRLKHLKTLGYKSGGAATTGAFGAFLLPAIIKAIKDSQT